MAVPLFDTITPLAGLHAGIDAAIASVVAGRRFILGPEVAAFEAEFAAYCGTRHAVGVANGTDALTIALRAMGVGPGDDVIVPSFTFYATAEAIPATGARPVFCDVDPDTYCVTAETVAAALTPATKAVVAVHLFGNLAPVARDRGARRARARGRRAGRRHAQRRRPPRRARPGRARSASFPPRTSAASATAARSRPTTTRSPRPPGCCASTARTTRSPTSTSATTRASTSCRRRSCACSCRRSTAGPTGAARRPRHYEAAGLGELVSLPAAADGCEPAWHLYVVRSERADELAAGLAERGIGAKAYYRLPVHRQPAMLEIAAGVELPVTDELARTHLAIPMSPVLSAEQAAEVTAAVRAVLAG